MGYPPRLSGSVPREEQLRVDRATEGTGGRVPTIGGPHRRITNGEATRTKVEIEIS